MRKGDLEMLEVRLEPLQIARDRLEAQLAELSRRDLALTERIKDLERDGEGHKTAIAQGLASIRSLLQRANRAAREQGIIEEDEVDPPTEGVHVLVTADERHRELRNKMGRTLL